MHTPHTIIIGLGQTGISATRFLTERNITCAMFDTREKPSALESFKKDFPQVPVYLETLPDEVIKHVEYCIVSPGIDLDEPFIVTLEENGVPVVGDVELFLQQIKKPVVAITGSNGKSTVTDMLGHCAKAAGKDVAVGGNIGVPALDMLAQDPDDGYILELSSFQLLSIYSLHANAAVILNISPDHLDRHASMQEYLAAKSMVYHNCQQAVINWDEPQIWRNIAKRFTQPAITFSVEDTVSDYEQHFHLLQKDQHCYLAYNGEALIDTQELPQHSTHFYANALAVLALANAMGYEQAGVLRGLCSYRGLPHRAELVATHNNVRWVNDSKGTNVGAASAVIASLAQDKNIIWLAGGDGKGTDFSYLADAVHTHVKQAILFGRDAALIAKAIAPSASEQVDTLQQAVQRAAELAAPGDVVLLSPACASFDQFSNYIERGELFTGYVNDLINT